MRSEGVPDYEPLCGLDRQAGCLAFRAGPPGFRKFLEAPNIGLLSWRCRQELTGEALLQVVLPSGVPFVGDVWRDGRRSNNRYGLVVAARVPNRPAISTATAPAKVTKFGMPSYEGPKISWISSGWVLTR